MLKVSSTTSSVKLGAAILHCLKENGREVTLRAVGPAAVNQTVKGITRAAAFANGDGLAFVPGFVEIRESGETRTAISFRVFRKGEKRRAVCQAAP